MAGGTWLVIKLLEGSQGVGVMLTDTVNSTKPVDDIKDATGISLSGKMIKFLELNAKPAKARTKGKGQCQTDPHSPLGLTKLPQVHGKPWTCRSV